MRRLFVASAIVGVLSVLTSARSQHGTVNDTYVFSIAGDPVAAGDLWLYHYDWGRLERHHLGSIHGGTARVSVSLGKLRDQFRPGAFARFVVALDVPGTGWYRSADLRDLIAAPVEGIRQLGDVEFDGGAWRVDLPPPVAQTLQLLNEDGSPWAGATIRLEPYLTEQNHCGHHRGFEAEDAARDAVHTVITDHLGEATFVAPLSPLYLESRYFVERRAPHGMVLVEERGDRLDAGARHIVRHRWHEASPRDLRIRVRRPGGEPVPSAVLIGNYAANTCGATTGQLGAATADGDILAAFAPEHYDRLWLADDARHELTADQLRELYSIGSLTVTIPAR